MTWLYKTKDRTNFDVQTPDKSYLLRYNSHLVGMRDGANFIDGVITLLERLGVRVGKMWYRRFP